MSNVLLLCYPLQISRRIVLLIAVNVVNNQPGPVSSDKRFSYQAMNHVFLTGYTHTHIAVAIYLATHDPAGAKHASKAGNMITDSQPIARPSPLL